MSLFRLRPARNYNRPAMGMSTVERILLLRTLERRRQSGVAMAVGSILAAVALVPIAIVVLAVGTTGVAYVALADELEQGLAKIQNLDQRVLNQSTRIYDRNGTLLREVLAAGGGRHTYVPLNEIPLTVRQATIAVEDKNFYSNGGVDPVAIVRALRDNVLGRPSAGGASTITQQFVRHVAFSDEERMARSYTRKAKEIILALILTRQANKDQILEWYLNEIYYGNLAWGIEAAARTVFDKPASQLNLAESALLAGLPQLPATYDPLDPNPDVQRRVRERQHTVLNLMAANGFISRAEADAAAAEEMGYAERDEGGLFLAPHFVVYAQNYLEELLGPERLARGGLEVTTTLDYSRPEDAVTALEQQKQDEQAQPEEGEPSNSGRQDFDRILCDAVPSLQCLAQRELRRQVAKVREASHLTNASLVALEPRTGQVLAMVGSVDYWDDAIKGRVNIAVRERQPGSSFKPITYVTALDQGMPASTVLWDVKMELWMPNGRFEPKNYDETFHGPVRLRAALANSYNIPALKLLAKIQPKDEKDAGKSGVELAIETAHRLGITGLNQDPWHYGLSLTLGGGEVTLLDMTTAYASLANGGRMVRPHPILKVTDSSGKVLYDLKADQAALQPQDAVDPAAAYIVTHILSDNEARKPAFGERSPLDVGVPAAVKTGTTNDYRDNWTLGYTPYLVVGVWAGNSDNSPMRRSSGITGAAPIWSAFVRNVAADAKKRAVLREARQAFDLDFPTEFERPEGVVEAQVCKLRSLANQLSAGCPETETELFIEDKLAEENLPESVALATPGAEQAISELLVGATGALSTSLGAGAAVDPVKTVTAVVVPLSPPPEAMVAAAAEAGEELRWPSALVCLPGGDGFGVEKTQPVTVLPVPTDVPGNVIGLERQFVLEWAQHHGWAALEPTDPCTDQMIESALAPGSLPGGAATVAGERTAPVAAQYRLNLAPDAVLTARTELTGTVVYDPAQIEYFKVELGAGREPTEWITLGDVHQGPIRDGPLEVLDGPSLAPGDYIVRLVLVKKDGNFLNPPFGLPIRIER